MSKGLKGGVTEHHRKDYIHKCTYSLWILILLVKCTQYPKVILECGSPLIFINERNRHEVSYSEVRQEIIPGLWWHWKVS